MVLNIVEVSMALIELTADDLCAMVSSPFPCEEGKIIDPVATAHFLGFVETTSVEFDEAAEFDEAVDESEPDSGAAAANSASLVTRAADPRLVMLSLACSMEASQAVTQARGGDESVKPSLDAFVDGALASPPELTTVFPPSGTVIVIGTVIITIPTPPPVPPRWDVGDQLGRTDLLALAARFQAASKMPGIGSAADDLGGAAARLIDAAIAR
jgi:hypothetical protein